MFEKEAEDWIKNNLHSKEEDYIKAFKDGAVFGYDKANEWHYVKDGDLPKKGITVLVMLENGQPDISGVSTDNRWFCTDYYTREDKVIAWKEIALPKENE